jgi:phage terminase small subunit
MELTPKQKAFADYYLETGNATEAAKLAGYSENSAKQIGTENLSKPSISQYIAERQKQVEDKRIADISEVLQFFTSVMRGEVKDQFDFDPSLSDRLSAGKELMKRYEKGDDGKKDALAKLDEVLKEIGGVV